MKERILITGGAGFIGSFTADLLLERGYEVVVLDALEPQVHGDPARWPDYLDSRVKRIRGDVGHKTILREALEGVTAVIHLAAVVGVGQSMYDIERYVQRNTAETATFLEVIATEYKGKIHKLIVASSMSVYGEGEYRCSHCGIVYPMLRSEEQLLRRNWEMRCPRCGNIAEAIPTTESKPLFPTSIYAITKRDQEEMALIVGRAYRIPTVALRYFNVYGPRQALSNPYTGVGAIFSSRLLNDNPPFVFEDGKQSRDFIHVKDIARANILALESEERAFYQAINIGTGKPTTVLQLAHFLAYTLGKEINPTIVSQFRQGDVRHCYADTRLARDVLGFEAQIPIEEGIGDLVNWVRLQSAQDRVDQAIQELTQRGLTL
ncbi:MAG TPA: NAD-dependent epimerase/dehydratase family protein [Anaerolineae bacterium]|nr:NAD-dependent epimerase/dehydratase family protein [Anaerolineae bacterium]